MGVNILLVSKGKDNSATCRQMDEENCDHSKSMTEKNRNLDQKGGVRGVQWHVS